MTSKVLDIINNSDLNDVQKINALKYYTNEPIKIVIMGSKGVGKTCYISFLQTGTFEKRYIRGVNQPNALITLPGLPEVELFEYDNSCRNKKFDACIIMCAHMITTLDKNYWIDLFKSWNPGKPIVVCRNKSDVSPIAGEIPMSIKNDFNCLAPLNAAVQAVLDAKYVQAEIAPVIKSKEKDFKSKFNEVLAELLSKTKKCNKVDKQLYLGERVSVKTIEMNGHIYCYSVKKDNCFHGRWTKSTIAGRLLVETMYSHGIKNGASVVWAILDDGTQYISEKVMYVDDKKHGVYTRYHNSTQIEEQKSYNYGILHGLHTVFDKNGDKVLEKTWNHGLLDGDYREWYPTPESFARVGKRFACGKKFNKRLKTKVCYTNGKRVGEIIKCYPNGCPKMTGYFCGDTGFPWKTWTYFNEDGYVEKVVKFQGDTPAGGQMEAPPIVSTTCYNQFGIPN